MAVTPSKENILKKIRAALIHPTGMPFPNSEGNQAFYKAQQQEMEIEFAEQFNQLQGRFIFCVNRQELAFQLNSLVRKQDWKKIFCTEQHLLQILGGQITERLTGDLPGCDISITGCEALVARTGSIVLGSQTASGRTASVFAPIHICIAFSNQLVYDINDALQLVRNKYGTQLPSLISFATGPSRTADIEKTLVVGVHGPKEVFLFLVDN
ncbi:MAG: lactate utilization protein B/C [Terrimonas sp.]|nr:lactate utilization protein B/C [Terrimonas sp.]